MGVPRAEHDAGKETRLNQTSPPHHNLRMTVSPANHPPATNANTKRCTGFTLQGSAYPTLSLQRPLQVCRLNAGLLVSTPLTFSAHTLANAVLDSSIQSTLRAYDPLMLDTLRILDYAVRGVHTPSATTKRRLVNAFGGAFNANELEQALDGDSANFDLESQWAMLMRGLGGRDWDLPFIASRLAAWDALFLEGRSLHIQGKVDEAKAKVTQSIAPSLAAWRDLCPSLDVRLCMPTDTALQVMAQLEIQYAKDLSLELGQTSRISNLLDDTRRPMGHWLYAVVQEAKVKNLAEFGKSLHRLEVKHKGRAISYDRLKQWASATSIVVPVDAAQALLKTVPIEEARLRLEGLFYLARCMTFLVDIVWAGTTKAMAWSCAQSAVKRRYEMLYQQFASVPGAA